MSEVPRYLVSVPIADLRPIPPECLSLFAIGRVPEAES